MLLIMNENYWAWFTNKKSNILCLRDDCYRVKPIILSLINCQGSFVYGHKSIRFDRGNSNVIINNFINKNILYLRENTASLHLYSKSILTTVLASKHEGCFILDQRQIIVPILNDRLVRSICESNNIFTRFFFKNSKVNPFICVAHNTIIIRWVLKCRILIILSSI